MNSELLQKVKDYFTVEFKQQISNSLDENSPAIDKSLSALIPLGMASIIQKSEKEGGSDNSLYSLATKASAIFPGAPELAKLHNEEAGSKVASDLLGTHEKAIRHAVAKYGGIKNESAAALILAGMPIMVGILGKHASENSWTSDQLRSYLSTQKEAVSKDLPDGVRDVGSLFGLSNATVDERHIKDAVVTDAKQPKNKGWIIPIIFAIAALLLLIYFSRGCNKPHDTGMNIITTSPTTLDAMILPVMIIR